MTTMIGYSVLYHIMKELKLTIEYLGRYKTKTDSTTSCNILQNTHCLAPVSLHTSTSFHLVTFRPYNTCWIGQKVIFTQTEKLYFPIWKNIVRSKSDHNDRMQCLLPHHEGTEAYNWISWKILNKNSFNNFLQYLQIFSLLSSRFWTAQ